MKSTVSIGNNNNLSLQDIYDIVYNDASVKLVCDTKEEPPSTSNTECTLNDEVQHTLHSKKTLMLLMSLITRPFDISQKIIAALNDNSGISVSSKTGPSSLLKSLECSSINSSSLPLQDCNLISILTTVVSRMSIAVLPVAESVAALSVEVQTPNCNFSNFFENLKSASKGERSSANNFKKLLFTNNNVSSSDNDMSLEKYIQLYGSTRDILDNANLEGGWNNVCTFYSGRLYALEASVKCILKELVSVTTHRIESVYNTKVLVSNENDFLLTTLLSTWEQLVSQEASCAVAAISDLEEKNGKKQPSLATTTSTTHQSSKVNEEEKFKGMSEEKIRKIKEKQQKKAAAAAAKALAKQKKQAAASSVLSVGSSVVYNHLKKKTSDNIFSLYETVTREIETATEAAANQNARRKPKIAKGAQDFLPDAMALRESIFQKVRAVFKRHGGVEIETPVFELKDTLTNKYGEDSKLIYDLADQGGEALALRYDLTVPFARFMACHNVGNIKRFHIARVYRRDNPQMARGRFREFYQCDFDIAGAFGPMVADAEVLSIGIEVLKEFSSALGNFCIKISHRGLLDGLLSICGVPSDKIRATCSAIDKLDKESWETVYEEMTEEKGLDPSVANNIKEFVTKASKVGEDPRELLKSLTNSKAFVPSKSATDALQDLSKLFDYLDAMNVLTPYVVLDLSLARGLDYYTGVIYEYILTDKDVGVGSIAAGGRYDNLVGMFSENQMPCVGVSLGIERIFAVMASKLTNTSSTSSTSTSVLVASTGKGLFLEKLKLCRMLWDSYISAEILSSANTMDPKFVKQLNVALERNIPYMIVIGEDELLNDVVKIKVMETKEEVTVSREEFVNVLLKTYDVAQTNVFIA